MVFLPVIEDVPFLGAFFGSPWFLSLFGPKATDKKGMGRLMG
jgi:hypothetical protein